MSKPDDWTNRLPGINTGISTFIVTCVHGLDLRFTPRCYLCTPEEPLGAITSSGAYRITGRVWESPSREGYEVDLIAEPVDR